MTVVARIARFSLTSADPGRLARFYADAFGFEPAATWRQDALPYGVPGQAAVQRLRLGLQEVELVGFEQPGAPYPAASTSHDGWFQHLALVVADMAAACERLSRLGGWQAISRGGPVALPESSGGVTAFKFRDPEGHPLELLAFPPGRAPAAWSGRPGTTPCLGIDHSAIVVADEARSLAFYAGLGLAATTRSLNQGPAQVRLDDAPEVVVGVVGLEPPAAPPHLELLAYRMPPVRPDAAGAADVACTRTVVIPVDTSEPLRMLCDPDGHRVMLVAGQEAWNQPTTA